jgi:hypothetical protein
MFVEPRLSTNDRNQFTSIIDAYPKEYMVNDEFVLFGQSIEQSLFCSIIIMAYSLSLYIYDLA